MLGFLLGWIGLVWCLFDLVWVVLGWDVVWFGVFGVGLLICVLACGVVCFGWCFCWVLLFFCFVWFWFGFVVLFELFGFGGGFALVL